MSMMFSLPTMKFIIGCFFLGVIIVTIARAEESYLEDLADEKFAGKKCPIYPPPENGALAITYIGSDALCSIQCMNGYDFETTPPALYLCVRGTWKFISLFGNTDTSLPWPNCAKTSTPGQLKMGILPFFYYHGDCNDPNTQVTLKQNFLTLSGFFQLCTDPAACTVDAVQMFCGNVKSPVRRRRRSNAMEKAAERLFECLRDDGKLAKACEKEFRQNIPKGMKRMFPCVKKALAKCAERPKDGNDFFHCVDGVEKCFQSEKRVEGST
ncbi:uncharacterized protein LOC114970030 [Acropora millepora]|uniref:uncharacterized protein LOC114970030 n=1 Tax=Acropora millepora TaxID=45264 RepID=UPI001CF5325F|nr:uncharacterized protein LOC114970030 [Acropora millepora]